MHMWIILAVLCGTGTSCRAQGAPHARPLPFTDAFIGSHGEGEAGEMWLHWSQDRRVGFAQGMLAGYTLGYKLGCLQAGLIANTMLAPECWRHISTVSDTPEHYAALMTAFYSKFGEDRALSIRELFFWLVRGICG